MKIIFDIETNGLLNELTEVHCIATYDFNKYELYTDIEEGLEKLSSADEIIGHNIAGFDIPAIQKVYPQWTYKSLTDTMLLWCILKPEEQQNSLENLALKMGLESKVQHEDWSKYTEEMGERCLSDVRINYSIYQSIINDRHHKMVEEALKIEQQVALIHARQTMNMVGYDTTKAIALYKKLQVEYDSLTEEIQDKAPWSTKIHGIPLKRQKEAKAEGAPVTKALKKNGEPTANALKWVDNPQGDFCKVEINPLNLDSSGEVTRYLLSLGWKPTEWNLVTDKETGEKRPSSPKLTEDSYVSLPEGVGQLIGRYNMIKHRKNSILGKKKTTGSLIIAKKYNGYVPADAFTCGTPTSRYRHSGAVCNIPRPSTPYGSEIRDLFTAHPGHWMAGIDLSGIEARMLAHYVALKRYPGWKEAVDLIAGSGDFHQANADAWSISRELAKPVVYSIFYGGGAKRVGAAAGRDERGGKKIKDDFYKLHPTLKRLMDDIKSAASRGFLKGLDGRPLYIRQPYRALNSLLQGSAACVFKQWMIKCNEEMPEGIKQIIAYHDELQFDAVTEEIAIEWKERVCEIALETGDMMNIKVPVEAEGAVGRSWKDTH